MSDQPSRAQFAEIVIAAARQAGFASAMTFNEADFSLHFDKSTMFLGNLHAQYCAGDPEQQSQLLANFIAAISLDGDAPITREQAVEQCVAVLRERAFFAFLDLRISSGEIQAQPIVHTACTEWFARCLVLDAPGYMRMITQDDLASWQISFDDLFEIGLERLAESSEPIFREEDGYFVGGWKDDYDASRVLLPELFEPLPLNGPPVFCLPNRATLLVADSTNHEAVQRMLAKAEEVCGTEPRPYNPAPLTLDDGAVIDFQVPRSSPHFHPIQRASKITALGYYEEQKVLLENLHEKTGKDLFVGKFALAQGESGEFKSFAVWSNGIPNLLPKTDVIMFFDPELPQSERIIGGVAWADVEAIAGGLILDTEMFPPRYYVSKFPTLEQFAAMPQTQP